MNSIILLNDRGIPVTTSRIIAEKFDKRHDNVLQSITLLECSQEFRLLNFEESPYKNRQNKSQPMFEITRNGFIFLVTGFTGKKAEKKTLDNVIAGVLFIYLRLWTKKRSIYVLRVPLEGNSRLTTQNEEWHEKAHKFRNAKGVVLTLPGALTPRGTYGFFRFSRKLRPVDNLHGWRIK